MPAAQSTLKRFRIERLEQRIAPGILFWADQLSDTMLAHWAVTEASDSQPQTHVTVARSTALEQSPAYEITSQRTSEKERVEFPAWAELILQEIDRELNSKPQVKQVHHGITDGVTFFSDFMKTPVQAEVEAEHFPVWAKELLADLEQRPEKDAVVRSNVVHDVRQSTAPDYDLDVEYQSKCEVGRFPAWAGELLSAVDRRIAHESRMKAAGRTDSDQLIRIDDIINRVRPAVWNATRSTVEEHQFASVESR